VLLREHAEQGSEGAFTEFVRRHINFVSSAATRMAIDPYYWEDVTQSVFSVVAQNANRPAREPVHSGAAADNAHFRPPWQAQA
jgi:hypothetical protein